MEKTRTILLILVFSVAIHACTNMQTGKISEDQANQSQQLLAKALDHLRNQQLPEAKQLISNSIQLNPGNAQAHHVAALVSQRSGQPPQAREHFKTALNLAPNNAGLLNNYGNFLCASGNYTAALEKFNQAAALPDNTQPAIAYTNAGLCALRKDKNEQARASFERAIQLDPTQSTALYQLARINLEGGKTLAASTLMEQYASHGKETSKTLLLRARVEHALGNYSNMEQFKQRLLEEFPDSPEVEKSEKLLANTSFTPESNHSIAPAAAQNLSDTDWLLSRNPGHYTLQILATEDKNTIQQVLETTRLESATRQYNFKSDGKTWLNLVMGDYSNLDSARRELEALPASLQQYNPWIRRFDSIQRVISKKGL